MEQNCFCTVSSTQAAPSTTGKVAVIASDTWSMVCIGRVLTREGRDGGNNTHLTVQTVIPLSLDQWDKRSQGRHPRQRAAQLTVELVRK
jgi:hypothetical protein